MRYMRRVCVGYTVLRRVIGLLLTKYFKRKSLPELHLPVGDVPLQFFYNWSNNARGHPLSLSARDMMVMRSKIILDAYYYHETA